MSVRGDSASDRVAAGKSWRSWGGAKRRVKDDFARTSVLTYCLPGAVTLWAAVSCCALRALPECRQGRTSMVLLRQLCAPCVCVHVCASTSACVCVCVRCLSCWLLTPTALNPLTEAIISGLPRLLPATYTPERSRILPLASGRAFRLLILQVLPSS